MSAFMVENESLRKIATVLRDCVCGSYIVANNHCFNEYPIKHMYGDYYKDSTPQEVYEHIYESLYKLNVDSLNYRYDDASDMYAEMGDIPKPIEGECNGVLWLEDYPLDNPEAFLKTCECYLYQCDESLELSERLPFRAVNTLLQQVALMCVHRTSAYDEADWA